MENSSEGGRAGGGPMGQLGIVTPVWGERHVSRFLDLVAPSWLAPGNLPALCARRRIGVCLLTRAADREHILGHEAFARLERHADIELIDVDDLLAPGFVPVSLTLAYQRGVRAVARGGARSAVVLLNGDFLLADGSLAGLADTLNDGARLVLASSLRVDEERLERTMRERVDTKGGLCLPPRELMRMALGSLHHTVASSRVDQPWVHSTSPNQLFWRLDADTLVGRPFCLFTLAMVLDGQPEPVGAYCDYGMSALWMPGVEPVILDDSDRFLALELAPAHQESDFTRLGAPTLDVIANQLSRWTTAHHRRQAENMIVYHCEGKPSLAAVRAQSDGVIASIASLMGPAQSDLDHPHWRGGVEGWRAQRARYAMPTAPPELRATPATAPPMRDSGSRRWRAGIRAALLGSATFRRPWHPFWSLQGKLTSWIAPQTAERLGPLRFVSFEAGVAPPHIRDESPTHLLAAIELTNPDWADALLEDMQFRCSDGRCTTLLLTDHADTQVSEVDIARVISKVGVWADILAVETMDLRRDYDVEFSHGRLADGFSLRRPWTSAGLVLASCAAAIAMVFENARRRIFGDAGKFATVALIQAKSRPEVSHTRIETGIPGIGRPVLHRPFDTAGPSPSTPVQ
jgi:hypothetical protein